LERSSRPAMPPSLSLVDPSGRFAYVANRGSNDISTYSIGTGGALASLGTTVKTGVAPQSVTVHPSGKFAYVLNGSSNDIWVYAVDASRVHWQSQRSAL
jgi:6-phosphogluconolactonase